MHDYFVLRHAGNAGALTHLLRSIKFERWAADNRKWHRVCSSPNANSLVKARRTVTRWSVNMKRTSGGFTLIELMIVVVIIGILAAIAIPNFVAMQQRAKEGSTKANMHTFQLASEDYGVKNNGAYADRTRTRL